MTSMVILCLCAAHPSALAGPTGASPMKAAWSDTRLQEAAVRFGKGAASSTAFRGANLSLVLPRLQRLQGETPQGSELFQHITFTLAYFGVDYQHNVHRLREPAELRMKSSEAYHRAYEYFVLSDVTRSLSRLYHHNHDPALLRALFSWRMDGHVAEELSSRS